MANDFSGVQDAAELGRQFGSGDIDKRDFDKGIRDLQEKFNSTQKKNDTPKREGFVSLLARTLDAGRVQTTVPQDIQYLDNLLQNIEKSTADNFIAVADGLVKTALDGTEDYIREQSFLLTQVNRELGLAGKLSQDFRTQVTEAQPDLVRIGVSFKDLNDSISRLVEDTGRFALVGTDMLTRAGEIATAYGMNMEEIVGAYDDFENVGIGAAQAQESIADAGKRSLELGIQSRRVIQDMIENIGKLNEFGFANGAEGLEKMVRRSIEVRMNLQDIFNVAEKVFDPEGALDLSANLQSLGVAFGDFNDPIRLMYMATNEVEGLGAALEGVSRGLATYNEKTGGFEVTGVNLRQAREAAKLLGMDVEQINKTAIALAERGSVDMALSGLQVTDEDKEFLANLSRMKDGKMQIDLTVPELKENFGTAVVQLDKLSQEGVQQILKYRDQFKELTESDLARQQVTLVENVARDVNYLATMARLRAAGIGDELLKQYAGMSFKETGEEYSKLLKMPVDKLAKLFNDKESATIQTIQKQLGIDKALQQEKEKNERLTNEANKPKEVIIKQEISHKSDQMMQGIQKEYVLNGEKFRMQGLGYLDPN